MASPPGWVPNKYVACTANCAKRPIKHATKNGHYCACTTACVNEGRCGCRLISRTKIARDPNEADGWKLGPATTEIHTCGGDEVEKLLPQLLYQCHCLSSVPGAGNEREVGKYEVFQDRAKKFRFRLKASNGEVVLASQGYTKLATCVRGAISVQVNGSDASRFVRSKTKSGKFRFNLTAANNRVIGTSETYESERSLETGIRAVHKASPTGRFINMT